MPWLLHRRFQRLPPWRSVCRASLSLAICLLAACHTRHPDSSKTAAAPRVEPARKALPPQTIERTPVTPEQRLGTVRVIGAHGNFVLIETPSASVTAMIPTGHLLHCRPPGIIVGSSSADLRVSPERRQPFLVADVLSGSPAVSDVAYLAREAAPPVVPLRPAIPYSSVISAAPPTPAPEATP